MCLRKVNVLLYEDEKSAAEETKMPHTFFCHRSYSAKGKKIGDLASLRGAPEVPAARAARAAAEAAPSAVPSQQEAAVHAESAPATAPPSRASAPKASSRAVAGAASAMPTAAAARAATAAQPMDAVPVVAGPACPDANAPAPAAAPTRKSTKTVAYDDFAVLSQEVHRLRAQVAEYAAFVRQLVSVEDRLVRL
eukprot:6202758-Pleurochrysis_carterae.AAC.1